MAITYDIDKFKDYRNAEGITDGNEVIFYLVPAVTYIMEAIVTSAGTAGMRTACPRFCSRMRLLHKNSIVSISSRGSNGFYA